MHSEPDLAVIAHARRQSVGLRLPESATAERRGRVPAILSCVFDSGADAFHIVFDDLGAADLPRTALADVEERRVLATVVDEFQRGVFVVLDDGTHTSFSAEFARFGPDEESPTADDARAAIAERVRSLREGCSWSVAEMSRRTEIAAPNLHRIEAAKHMPTATTLLRLAAAFGVPLDRLLRSD
jgi:DNA-binding XRE family transcriptional regulator